MSYGRAGPSASCARGSRSPRQLVLRVGRDRLPRRHGLALPLLHQRPRARIRPESGRTAGRRTRHDLAADRPRRLAALASAAERGGLASNRQIKTLAQRQGWVEAGAAAMPACAADTGAALADGIEPESESETESSSGSPEKQR